MIRKLSKQDHQELMLFLSAEPSINLFIIGDIEAFGYDCDFQEIWGYFNEYEDLQGILLRYHSSFIPYTKDEEFDVSIFSEILMSFDEKLYLSGKSDLVEKFEQTIGPLLGKKQKTFFAECQALLPISSFDIDIQIATIDDVDELLELRSSIEEFYVNENARKMLVQSINTNTGRTYFIRKNGKMVASASTTAENSLSAMIVAVCTHPEYRNLGLATSLIQKLGQDILSEGKTLCLFYDNPAAGRIYKRLGFKDIGKWTMFR